MQTSVCSCSNPGASLLAGLAIASWLCLIVLSCGGGGGGGSTPPSTPPVTPPTAPMGVTATGANSQVSLTWSASSGATSYKVKRAGTSGGPYTEAGAPTATNYTNTGLTNGTTYYYVVSAVNSAGESANSGEVSATPTTAGQITSLEFGHSGYPVKDYCNVKALPSDFGNGFIFSAWTKITKPVTPGTRRGNQGILYVHGDNWSVVTVNSNIAYNEMDFIWNYNANYMFTEGLGGDFCTYYSTPEDAITLEQCNDWVWAAWQIVVNNDRTITLRQWLKFGLEGRVIPAGNRKYDINFNQIGILDPPGEEITNVLSFEPSNPRSFRVGVDNTYSGYGMPSSSYICHARLEARSSKPTLLELDAIARLNRADPTAWGDWELNWKDGAPNLSDRSGHGNHLSIQPGGALYQGVLGPAF